MRSTEFLALSTRIFLAKQFGTCNCSVAESSQTRMTNHTVKSSAAAIPGYFSPRPHLEGSLLSAGFPYKEETQRPIVSYNNIPNLINL